MDIVEIEGKPIAKRGKLSGSKRLLRCPNCFRRKVIPVNSEDIKCECGGKTEDLLVKLIDNGKLVGKFPSVSEIRNYVLSQYKYFSL
jgi:nicotinate phosphoribosyltransferase